MNTSHGRASFLAEQCSVRPPISAFFAEDEKQTFRVEGDLSARYLFQRMLIQEGYFLEIVSDIHILGNHTSLIFLQESLYVWEESFPNSIP